MNVSSEEQALAVALAVAQWQSFIQNAGSLPLADPNPRLTEPRRGDETNPELAESWFGHDARRPRIITSRPPPSQPPLGDPLADAWFRE